VHPHPVLLLVHLLAHLLHALHRLLLVVLLFGVPLLLLLLLLLGVDRRYVEVFVAETRRVKRLENDVRRLNNYRNEKTQ
jgi:hypothetical protein